MISITLGYKTIKDSASLSGRGADKQWIFFDAMDELLAKDPVVTTQAVSSCFSAVGMLSYHMNILTLVHNSKENFGA